MKTLLPALLIVLAPAAASAQGPGAPMGMNGGTGAMGTFGAGGAMGTLGAQGPMGIRAGGPMGLSGTGAGGPMGSAPATADFGGGGRTSATLGSTSSIGTARATRNDPSGAARIRSEIGSPIGTTVNSVPSRTVEGDAPAN